MEAAAAAAAAQTTETLESSPGSRESYNEEAGVGPATATAQQEPSKVRLMCSYGGHIVPRPHDKSLCYIGGETRIMVVERHKLSVSSLVRRLSQTLLKGRGFSLKYQLPKEDLDSLVTVCTDEDLENMLDEYDRVTSSCVSCAKSSRIRLFLFPFKPHSSQSLGPIIQSTVKADDDWFVTALNATATATATDAVDSFMLNRGFSDPASVNYLLGLDDHHHSFATLSTNTVDFAAATGSGNGSPDAVGGAVKVGLGNVRGQNGQDLQSVPDSPMLDTSSSFGSTSSSPSLANLPPIRVHVDDQKVGVVGGIEEQFAQISVSAGGGVMQKQEDGFFVYASPPVGVPISGVLPIQPQALIGAEYPNRVVSDDERLDHGAVPAGTVYRKPTPAQLQQQQHMVVAPPPFVQPQQQKLSGGGANGAGVTDLPSPDSVSSDNSLNNVINKQKPVVSQDPHNQVMPNKVVAPSTVHTDSTMMSHASDPNPAARAVVQDSASGYVLQQPQYEQPFPPQPQFIHTGATHYIHHPTGGVPISEYYPIYPPQQQQQQQQNQHQHQHQYPVYYVSARQPLAYMTAVPATNVPSSGPQTPPNPPVVSSTVGYNQARYPPAIKPEIAATGMYRTTTTPTGTPQLVHIPSGQQQQYIGYAYEYGDPAHSQVLFTQPLPPNSYQTMTGASVVMPEGSAQHPADNVK